jgi:hypothetical protein
LDIGFGVFQEIEGKLECIDFKEFEADRSSQKDFALLEAGD